MEKTILLTLTYLVGIGELILAGFFWKTHSNNEIRKVMALLTFNTAAWVLLSGLLAYNDDLFLNRLIYFVGVFVMTSLLHLVLIFPYPFFRIDRIHKLLLYIPALMLGILAVFSGAVVQFIVSRNDITSDPVGGPAFALYNFYLLALYLVSLFILVLRRKRTDGTHKRNIQIFLFSLILGGLPAVYIDLIAPTFGFPFSSYLHANIATGIWWGGVLLILSKK